MKKFSKRHVIMEAVSEIYNRDLRSLRSTETLSSGRAKATTKTRSRPYLPIMAVLTLGTIAYIHAYSAIGYFYYFILWLTFYYIFEKRKLREFSEIYVINGFLIGAYFLVQTHFYPESYGTTSPYGAQTDDSYFFSLVADELPSELETRDNFFLYNATFSQLVRALTLFRVSHPLDVIFFLSGVSAMVCIYTKEFALQITKNESIGRTAYYLCLFCPLMLMNGGAVFVRDTFVGGLFMLSLCCVNNRRLIAFVGCFLAQLFLRPGTALILSPLYLALFLPELAVMIKSRSSRIRIAFLAIIGVCGLVGAVIMREEVLGLLQENNVYVDELRREGMDDIISSAGRGAFARIQEQPREIRVVLSTAYMYLVPFLSFQGLITQFGFDARILCMNVLYPFWMFFVHAWVVGAIVGRQRKGGIMVRSIALTILFGCFLIGTFSAQSRHKVIIQPLVYILAAAGLRDTSQHARALGYVVSAIWLASQLVYALISRS